MKVILYVKKRQLFCTTAQKNRPLVSIFGKEVFMATTRLISMHQNKGESIADCLADRTDYAKNPDKTNDGEYISSYECDPKTVQGEFLLSKRIYLDITGREQTNDVIAYQIRQSFKPREITPELANQVGYELGMRFTKGNHAFFVATHIDKAHIHNHIIFNSTSLDCTKKFRDFLGSGRAVRKISDRIVLKTDCLLLKIQSVGKTIMANGLEIKNLFLILKN